MGKQEDGVNLLSVVIPTYKSEANIIPLAERLQAVLSKLPSEYEVIFINDNSPDNTIALLQKLCLQNLRIKVISLSRNFGQQIATSAGLKFSSGDAVIIMDDDLQDPPELIPSLVQKWKDGYDVVYAIRKNRKEGFFKKLGYRLFYKIIANISYISIPQNSGDFGLMDRKIVDILNSMPERMRFVRGLRAWVGFKQAGIEYERAGRFKGKPSYNLLKILNLSMSGILAFSDMPLRISSLAGFFVSAIAFIGIVFTIIQKIITYFLPYNPIAVWPGFSTIVLAILFLGGVQLLCMGILGEYIARIYNEIKQRPMFLVKEIINFDKKNHLQN